MATLWIREYSAASAIDVPVEPGTDQTVTFTTTTQSAAFGTGGLVTIIADAAFHYVVGANPTATTSNLKVPADTLLTMKVAAGQKIAAVTAA